MPTPEPQYGIRRAPCIPNWGPNSLRSRHDDVAAGLALMGDERQQPAQLRSRQHQSEFASARPREKTGVKRACGTPSAAR